MSQPPTKPFFHMPTFILFKYFFFGLTKYLFNRNKNFAASEVAGGKKTVESLSVSSMEEVDIMERGEDSYDASDGNDMEQGITNTFSQPLHQSQDLHPHAEMKPNTSSGISQVS